MKKSLAQLKRDLKVGTKLKPTYHFRGEKACYEREIIKTQSNAFVTIPSDHSTDKGMWCYLPNASLVEYEDNKFSVYDIGYRKFTEDEQKFYDNRPSQREENKKLVEYDLLTDCNTTYYMDKKYFEESKYKYLFMNWTNRGNGYLELKDSKTKGRLVCTFEIV